MYTGYRKKRLAFWGRSGTISLGSAILLAVTLTTTRESLVVVISYLLDLSLVGRKAGSHVLFFFPFFEHKLPY